MKNTILRAYEVLGVNRLFRKNHLKDTTVLMYHGVVKDEWETAGDNWLMVKESEFEKQMKFLSEDYTVIPLDEMCVPNTTGKPYAAITFDDGYRNNYTVAYPILKKYRLPATIFPVVNAIDTKNLFWYDRIRVCLHDEMNENELQTLINQFKDYHPTEIDKKVDEWLSTHYSSNKLHRIHGIKAYETYGPMTKADIYNMNESGLVTFASHTSNHEILTHLTVDEVRENVRSSTEKLENIVPTIPYFCYPNGSFKPEFHEVLMEIGFVGATTTDADYFDHRTCRYQNTKFMEISRWGVGRSLPFCQFPALICGSWKWTADKVKTLKKVFKRSV